MPIQTATQKNNLAIAYGAAATHAAAYTTVPGAAQGTEPTGGSPAYARKPIGWGAPNTVGPLGAGSQPALPGVIYAQVVIDIPTGTTLLGIGVHSAISGAGNYLDGAGVTSQPFATQGTYTANLTYSQT